MSIRTSLSTLTAATLAGSVLLLAPSPATAAVAEDDPSFTPVAADLIGVGSDTTMHALHLLAEGGTVGGARLAGWNGQTPAPAFRIASFSALGGGKIALPGGEVNRPNGSGSGKATLYGAGNNPDVDFARSSSANSAAETQAGLKAFPFALDVLQMAVSNSVASHAPASLTGAQIVSIYKGDVTNWSQLGGTAGVIAPKIPQAGSGTRSFFEGQLKALNGGVAVTLGANVAEVQEHDDSAIKSDPNAIAPFSVGRAGLLGSTLRLAGGWEAKRAVYNVVRGADVGRPDIQAVFGEGGFVCSTAARPLIEAAGFSQLATPADGGVCGAPTTDATSNFTLNEAVVTTTALTATSSKGGSATLVAAVSGGTSPAGSVSFYEGETLLQAGVPLVSGRATHTVTGASAGSHTYRAVFVPAAGTKFEGSEATATVAVKAASTISEAFPAKVAKGKRATGVVTVEVDGGEATGTVKVTEGGKTLATGRLAGGQATVKLPKLAKGAHKLTVSWAGSATAAGASTTFTIKQK